MRLDFTLYINQTQNNTLIPSMKLQSLISLYYPATMGFRTINGFWFMFFIFPGTMAVNMNLGDQANLAALLRSLA